MYGGPFTSIDEDMCEEDEWISCSVTEIMGETNEI